MAGSTPVGGDAHVDVPLSNFASMAFASGSDMFIGDQLFPEIPVGKQSDKYYEILKDGFLMRHDTLRSPKTEAKRVNFTVSSNSYYAENYALASENAMEDIINADDPVRLRENSVMLVQDGLRLDQEVRIANLVTSISNVGSGVALSGADKWSDGSSDPVASVNTAHSFIRANTGLVANTAVIDWDTLMVVRRHPTILDLFKYTDGGEATDAQLMSVFKVSRMLVAQGVYNTAAEGATASMSNIWGNYFGLFHVGPGTGLQSKTFGGRFRWRNPIYPADFAVLTAVENAAGQKKVEVVETGYFQDEKVIARDLSYAITDTL